MTNVNNYSNRGLPSIHYGRTNIWNRYHEHAVAKQNASVFDNCCHTHYQSMAPPSTTFGSNMFGMTNWFGMSNSWLAGNVVGQTIGLCAQFAQPIGNFFKGLFNRG